MISEVFTHAAYGIRTQGWATGVESDERGGWCLMGAVGAARLRLMSRRDRQRFVDRKGLAHYDQAIKTPFNQLIHDDEELRRAVTILYAAYRSMTGLARPGDDRPRIDYRDYRAIEKATSDMMAWNDSMTGPGLVLNLLERAAILAFEIEVERMRVRCNSADTEDMRWQAQRLRDLERERVVMNELRALASVPPVMIVDEGWPTDSDLATFFSEQKSGKEVVTA
jgi:hypothetical protein